MYAPRTKLQHLYFYPRPPRGGRPHNAGDGAVHVLISIHALREEGDMMLLWSGWTVADFYPRPPRGGRRAACLEPRQGTPFLSTPSARRATDNIGNDFMCSIFLSTPSARRATIQRSRAHTGNRRFLSTPSARRATRSPSRKLQSQIYFYPRPPRGGRRLRAAG